MHHFLGSIVENELLTLRDKMIYCSFREPKSPASWMLTTSLTTKSTESPHIHNTKSYLSQFSISKIVMNFIIDDAYIYCGSADFSLQPLVMFLTNTR